MWAVGYQFGGGGSSQPIFVHWDGSQWTLVPGAVVNWYNQLHGISVIASDDAWAIGYSGCEEGCQSHTLIEHWNGHQWYAGGTPNFGTGFDAIEGIASNDVWAVGPQIINWDGSEWSVVPDPGLGSPYLTAIDAVSANDVWAVGYYYGGPNSYPSVVSHWDGTSWSLSSAPDVGKLAGVKALSTNDVWAVGSGDFLHWDGTAWTEVDNPTGGGFEAVDGISTDDVWAVGYSLVAHWDGSRWSEVPGPDGNHKTLLGVYAA